jgi:hypothetical protein
LGEVTVGKTKNFSPAVLALPASFAVAPVVDDVEMARLYSKVEGTGAQVLFVANAFTAALWSRSSLADDWSLDASGELGDMGVAAIVKNLGHKRTFWLETTLADPLGMSVAGVTGAVAKKGSLNTWLKKSNQVTGRFGNASSEVKREVAYLAANRCQFSGCGKDLGQHASTGEKNNSSYFAHIIAASADGPRGDPIQSALLANEPTNFLLLCDECHRLIDKTAVAKYTVDVLCQMRSNSIQAVRRVLDTLQNPDADVLYFLGNVTGQMPHISERDMEEALWKAGLRRSKNAPESYFAMGGQHYNPHDPAYWSTALRTLQLDLPQLQAKLSGIRTGGGPRPRLAVFVFHGTSVLVLAGRVLGDMAGTNSFHSHRNTWNLGETRWAWPDDASTPAQEKFEVRTLKDRSHGEDEVNLIVSLTFAISPSRLADVSAANGILKLPTLAVSVEAPSHSAIRHPADLALFGKAVDDALRQIQDEWKVKKVHLYVGAPASAVLLIGQKMQARNHTTYVCYESLPGLGAQFARTITISSQEVRAIGTDLAVSLQP